MKTSELTGALLDYWVARAEGISEDDILFPIHKLGHKVCAIIGPGVFAPSTDWAVGGPIIENEGIGIAKYNPSRVGGEIQNRTEFFALSYALSFEDSIHTDGPTMLIAAMRCYVASKYGDEVPDA